MNKSEFDALEQLVRNAVFALADLVEHAELQAIINANLAHPEIVSASTKDMLAALRMMRTAIAHARSKADKESKRTTTLGEFMPGCKGTPAENWRLGTRLKRKPRGNPNSLMAKDDRTKIYIITAIEHTALPKPFIKIQYLRSDSRIFEQGVYLENLHEYELYTDKETNS